ncbi:hypothetical protein L1987_06039 [Smallanthus sonchifolius]|uniref:Uncharacterized protein n=1 Tax=Smallanthus sonchifolius TaxID=185202 RepID=A0ACB9JX56_9ASTR|nr:hypothetical protein L1987_06039 [Smallanthus sonchifolius]
MWKLKIAQGNDPYLFTTNNFVGRQFWEFDPEAGTPEERQEVENARQNFLERKKEGFRTTSDLLMRIQLIRENGIDVSSIPPARLGEDDGVNYEAATTATRKAVRLIRAIQAKDGHWATEHAGPLFFTPPLIIIFYISGAIDTHLTKEHKKEMKRFMYNHQGEDGGWGFHIEGQSTMFVTVLSYIALRLLGEEKDDANVALTRARKWILDHGGATCIPSWGKLYLSVLGVYEWEGCNPIPPEFWIFPESLPFHPDLYYPHSIIQDLLWDGLHYLSEPLFKYWPFTKLRERALKRTIELTRYNAEESRYITMASIEKGFQMMCWWAENPNGDEFKHHLARVPDYLWLAEDGMKSQTFGSQLWISALATQAIIASNMPHEYGDSLKKAHFYLKESQVTQNPTGDFNKMCRQFSKGAWTFSDQDHGWPVSDCTGEALKCLLLLSQMPDEISGEKVDKQRLYDAVNFLLYVQSPTTGGFAVWEPPIPQPYLQMLNPSEMFADIVFEREHVECTTSVMQALIAFKQLHPGHRAKEIEHSVTKAVCYLENTQWNDGSWYGYWGICFIYGTFFSLGGLESAGKNI